MKKISLLLALTSLLAACEPSIANRGNLIDPDNLAAIKPGISTRETVAATLGTPTVISTFDDKVWYYVGRQTEQYSFLAPAVVKQQAIEIDFNNSGTVVGVHNLDLSKAAEASPVDRETPTFGQKNTLLRELLGDLSHPKPDLKNPSRGGGN